MHCGLQRKMSQLGHTKQVSRARRYQTPNISYVQFRYGVAYDQHLRSIKGFLNIGLPELDSPDTWTYLQFAPNDSLFVFPKEEELKASLPAGFGGNSLHFKEDFMVDLARNVYRRPLYSLIPTAGMYRPTVEKQVALRGELVKWQLMQFYDADTRPAIVSRREESFALLVIDALADEEVIENDNSLVSERAISKALEIIHSNEFENISAAKLCQESECSQRTLEKAFLKRFGVTTKKYIKYLRLAEVHRGLRNFDAQGCESIIELAGIHGFWHMGQFARDYHEAYGELPSETLNKIKKTDV